ncbi:Cytosolic sulfotransferase 14 [Hibiscus syriacus]|uniref:Sulfotransferase n=2 Tax=Hibiscus syriacus TaxID=106335 RepID=A0A6A3C1D0_HIBSY|nr:Cytosolic sulfotransferase 14 [Hibiscus syriacus]
MIPFQIQFQALDTDIIVASFPKCGTTWLKALTFTTVNRHQFAMDENPLLTSNPHQLVRSLEYDLYMNNPFPDLDNSSLYNPRLFATQVPYTSLPTSIKDSDCKIVFICRNPMDMFISLWVFRHELRDESLEPVSIDEAFDMFCHGVLEFVPFIDYVLGYWKESQENPNKILFLQYEDLKEDVNYRVKELVMFLGVPFTEEEERQGVVEERAKICSFDSLKELEVNKKGVHTFGAPNETSSKKAETFVVPHRVF